MGYTKTQIVLRNDISAQWDSVNPVLLKGEFGFDQTRKYIKIGDGTTHWKDLATVRLPKSAIDDLQDVDTNTIYDFSGITTSGFTLVSADGTLANPVWGEVKKFTAEDWQDEIDTTVNAVSTLLSGDIKTNREAIATLNSADTVEGSVAKSIKDAIGALDVDELALNANEAIASIKEVDGKIEVSKQAIQLTGIAQVTDLEDTILSAEDDAIDAAKEYTNEVSTALSTDYSRKAADAQAAGELSAQAVRDDLTAFIKYTDANIEVTDENKVATMADVAGLSGVTHLRDPFENDPETSHIDDKDYIIANFENIKKGDIFLNTKNGKEYLAIADNAIAAQIRELGDEGLYETKADSEAKLAEAKKYTDDAISALDVEDSEEDHKFVTAVSETDGKIAVTRAALLSDDIPELSNRYDVQGDAAKALEDAKDYTDGISTALSTDYYKKIASTATDLSNGLSTYAEDGAADALSTAKKYADDLSVAYDKKIAGKVALSTLAEVDAALSSGYVRDVYVNDTSVVDATTRIANLKALANKDTVGTAEIDDAAVTTAKIADGTVTNAKIAAQSVTEDKLSGLFILNCGGANGQV